MCGRFTDQITWAELRALYQLAVDSTAPSNMQPQFNIAPTDDVDFVHLDRAGNRELDRGRWWLVPWWAKELPKAAMFNARIETVDKTAAFRDAFETHRCLIPADGYFEWTTSLVDGKKDPWLLQLPAGKPFSFAGLWAHNKTLGVTSCTIVTAPAVPHIDHIHGRMPVILSEDAYAPWLDPATPGPAAKSLLLEANLDGLLEFYRVDRKVNSSKYEGEDTKVPIAS